MATKKQFLGKISELNLMLREVRRIGTEDDLVDLIRQLISYGWKCSSRVKERVHVCVSKGYRIYVDMTKTDPLQVYSSRRTNREGVSRSYEKTLDIEAVLEDI